MAKKKICFTGILLIGGLCGFAQADSNVQNVSAKKDMLGILGNLFSDVPGGFDGLVSADDLI